MRLLRENPVLDREFGLISRTWASPMAVSFYVLALGGIGLLYTVVQLAQPVGAGFWPRLGASTYGALLAGQLLLIMFVAPHLGVGALTGERERGTLDLVLLSDLPTWHIVVGKLLPPLWQVTTLLLASLPIHGMVFLVGGVPPSRLAMGMLILTLTGWTMGAAGVFFSAVCRRTQQAALWSLGLALLLAVGTVAAATLLTSGAFLGSQGKPATALHRATRLAVSASPILAVGSATGGPFFGPLLGTVIGPAGRALGLARLTTEVPVAAALTQGQAAASQGLVVALPVDLVWQRFVGIYAILFAVFVLGTLLAVRAYRQREM